VNGLIVNYTIILCLRNKARTNVIYNNAPTLASLLIIVMQSSCSFPCCDMAKRTIGWRKLTLSHDLQASIVASTHSFIQKSFLFTIAKWLFHMHSFNQFTLLLHQITSLMKHKEIGNCCLKNASLFYYVMWIHIFTIASHILLAILRWMVLFLHQCLFVCKYFAYLCTHTFVVLELAFGCFHTLMIARWLPTLNRHTNRLMMINTHNKVLHTF